MTDAKQILLAGFAALCMVLPACRSTSESDSVEPPPLVDSNLPLTAASYTAEYTQDGALPFTCEVKLGTGGRIRRDYVWKDEKDTDRKVSIMIDGDKAVKIEDGKSVSADEADAAQARFFAGLVLNQDSVVSSARRNGTAGKRSSAEEEGILPCNVYTIALSGIPGMASCVVEADPKSNRWSKLKVRLADDSDVVFSSVFSEYKLESGVTYPSRIVSSTENGAPVFCTIRDVKINPELPDELFRLPDING